LATNMGRWEHTFLPPYLGNVLRARRRGTAFASEAGRQTADDSVGFERHNWATGSRMGPCKQVATTHGHALEI
jgi:hypothetical protein